MIAGKNTIIEYLPQRPPVVMIHHLLESDDKHTVSELMVEGHNVFLENGKFSESGLVENIAQTAAAGVGYRFKMENKKVPVGFIASIRDLKIHHLPAPGALLRTEVLNVDEIMGVSIIRGTVMSGNDLCAECEMRIFLKPD